MPKVSIPFAPFFYIRPESDLWLPLSLTHCLIDLIDVTLTFEDANSNFLDVVSVADINALECEDYRLVEIMKLMFGQEYEPEYFF